MAKLDDILAGVKDAIEGLSLTVGGEDLIVSVRDLLVAEEGVDVLPLVLAAGEGPLSWTPFQSEGKLRVEYAVGVALVSAWNGDATRDSEDVNAARQAIALLLSAPSFADPLGALMVRAMSPDAVDKAGWSANLKAAPLRLAVSVIEEAG